MPEFKIPTAGRIVHFFHNGVLSYSKAANNGAVFVPAIITQAWGNDLVNMTIFPAGENPVFGWSIHHKSEALEGSVYWDYPEIKQ